MNSYTDYCDKRSDSFKVESMLKILYAFRKVLATLLCLSLIFSVMISIITPKIYEANTLLSADNIDLKKSNINLEQIVLSSDFKLSLLEDPTFKKHYERINKNNPFLIENYMEWLNSVLSVNVDSTVSINVTSSDKNFNISFSKLYVQKLNYEIDKRKKVYFADTIALLNYKLNQYKIQSSTSPTNKKNEPTQTTQVDNFDTLASEISKTQNALLETTYYASKEIPSLKYIIAPENKLSKKQLPSYIFVLLIVTSTLFISFALLYIYYYLQRLDWTYIKSK